MTPPLTNPTIALIGATGFIGRAITRALEPSVSIVKVRAPRNRTSAKTVSGLRGAARQLDASEFATKHLTGADVVVNAAGIANATATDLPDLLGANAVLPAFLARAAAEAGIRRFIHVSSAAVQGRGVLDESEAMLPENEYALSKALGEVLLRSETATEVIRYRPTSVQGADRGLTQRLVRIAQSPLAAVAAPGTRPTPQIPVTRVANAVRLLADLRETPPAIVLHPWEGVTTSQLLTDLGGRAPRQIPPRAAHLVVEAGYRMAGTRSSLLGQVRRVDMMLIGQEQRPGWLDARGSSLGPLDPNWLSEIRETVVGAAGRDGP